MTSAPPKFACTSAPTAQPPSAAGSRRDAVPMPPFQPKAMVPVPAPTLPSATGPPVAATRAASMCACVTPRARISFSRPSLVSPTTALTLRTSWLPGCASVQSTSASTARPTASVLVSRIGVSSSPSSCSCVTPAILPKPLKAKTPAGTRWAKGLPACGRIAVTPVRVPCPSITVQCPTRRPATSVMAFSGPGGRMPGARPSSRARGMRGTSLWRGAALHPPPALPTTLRR